MSRRIISPTLLALAISLLLIGMALAAIMSSANYALSSLVVDGSGGGPAASANYAVNLTVGQAVIGPGASANYRAGIGYWPRISAGGGVLYLPTIFKGS